MRKVIPLEPADYIFLLGENRQQPMHVGCLLFYQAPPGEDAGELATANAEQVKTYTQAVAPFNYRLVQKWGLSFWQEDPEFDVTNHVRHVQLPHPGDIKELLKLVGVFHGLTMDRSMPLWYLWIISGLPDNRYAAYLQIHHALLDGVSGARMMMRAHSTDPDERGMPPFWAMPPGKNAATSSPAAASQEDMQTDLLSMGVGLFRSNRKLARAFMQSWQNDRDNTYSSDMFSAPDTILNQQITGARRFVADSFSLPRMKAAGKALDATLNDILLIMTSRALQLYLKDLDELPYQPLRVLMPVNLREDDSVGGNQVMMVRASMGTQHQQLSGLIDEVLASVNAQKRMLRKLSKNEKLLYAGVMLAPWLANVATGKLGRLKTANTLISNVPGPRETLYWNGLEVDAMYPVSIPVHQSALNFTVFSYRDKMELGIIGCRNKIPHLQRILDYMHQALGEIEAVAQSR